MRISTIQIHNFRSIRDVTISLGPYTLLVGPNNAGKSNVIDAIRCFFGKIPFDKMSDFPKSASDNKVESRDSFIQIRFEKVQKSDLPDKWKNARKSGNHVCIRLELLDEKGKPIQKYRPVDGQGDTLLKTLPETFQGTIIYIPSMSKPSDELRFSGPSVLREMIGAFFGPSFDESQLSKSLNAAIKQFVDSAHVTESTEPSILNQVEKALSQAISRWGATFALDFKPLSGADIVRNLLQVRIVDTETNGETDVTRFGSGFQRNLLFQLLKCHAEFAQSEKHDASHRLILFEEPEAFLHPDQQSELSRNLRKIAGSGIGYQVLCTTHSPAFVSGKMDDVPCIVRLSRTRGITSVHQLAKKRWNSLLADNGQYPTYLKQYIRQNTSNLDTFRYVLWMNSQRASFFFARQVLLVEGATDLALIQRLQDDDKLHLPEGTVVFDCLGKFNFHRFMALLRAFGIPHAVMYDTDSGKTDLNARAEQSAWNRFVEEECKKASPPAKSFPVPADIETYFGSQKSPNNRDDLKPFLLMKQYSQFNSVKVSVFVKSIESLFL